MIGPRHAAEIDAARAEYEAAGVAPDVARLIAGLPQLLAACDIVRTAPAAGGEAAQLDAARAYFALDGALDLPWLKACIRATPRRGRWDRLALTGLEDDLSWILRGLTQAALAAGAAGTDAAAAQGSVEAWLESKLQGLDPLPRAARGAAPGAGARSCHAQRRGPHAGRACPARVR